MDVAELAERIVFGRRLADKLIEPGELTDDRRPPAIAVPDSPGRPAGLAFETSRSRPPLPAESELDRVGARGRLLHFFANHELLALELMALSLLRFPDTPDRYRRGVVRTIRDEQEHLRLYLARMADCGVELGDQPVNDFFWRWIHDARDPVDFVVLMNLTFEQANLDYARHYSKAFGQAGDATTAALLRRIVDDEIGHVKHGLVWFNRWREPSASEWEAYRAHLKPPLGPSRAKGIGFNWEARRKVGFTEDYIEELAVATDSQGRPPRVFWFDPTVEDAIAEGKGYDPPTPVRELVADLETLPLFLAARDDVVWTRRAPRARFLLDLETAGFDLPEVVSDEREGVEALADRPLAELCPWGWSPGSEERMRPLRGQLTGDPGGAPRWDDELARVYSKAFDVEQLRRLLPTFELTDVSRLCDPSAVGRTCRDRSDTAAAIDDLRARGAARIVVKAALGAAGRHRCFVDAPKGLEAGADSWVERTLHRQGAVVVEPWLDGVADLSYHFSLSGSGEVVSDGLIRFLTDDRGRFEGCALGRTFDEMPPDVVRFVYGDGRDPKWLQRVFERVARALAEPLHDAGYIGPVGVDALVFRDASGELRLKPIVEVNPRYTMGRVALHLERHLWRGRAGLWRFAPLGRARSAGFDGGADLARHAARAWPADVGHTPAARLRGGVVFTTDPERARRTLTVLSVAPTLERCGEQLRDLFGSSGGPRRS